MENEQHQTRLLATQEKANTSGSPRRTIEDTRTQRETYLHPESAQNSLHQAVETSEQRKETVQAERIRMASEVSVSPKVECFS